MIQISLMCGEDIQNWIHFEILSFFANNEKEKYIRDFDDVISVCMLGD